jgi:hypothetical protein
MNLVLSNSCAKKAGSQFAQDRGYKSFGVLNIGPQEDLKIIGATDEFVTDARHWRVLVAKTVARSYTERSKLPRSVSGHGFSRAATGRLYDGALAPGQRLKPYQLTARERHAMPCSEKFGLDPLTRRCAPPSPPRGRGQEYFSCFAGIAKRHEH